MANFILHNTEPINTISQYLTSNIVYDGGALGNIPATTNSDLNTVLTDLNATLASYASSFAGITGTGTKIAKFTGASTLGDSLLSEAAKVVTLSGTTSTLNEFKVNDSAKDISLGVRGSAHSSGVTANGAQADAFIITGTGVNGLNIIKNAGGGSEADYLRFYAGNTPTSTSRIHITGKTSGASEIGNVGINQEVPDKRLEVLDTATQLRLTHTNASKFVDFTVDTNHDLLVKPSSTGQIKLQPTTDSTDFFQVLDADGGTPILNVDATNERVGVGIAAPTSKFHVSGDSYFTDHVSIANQKELKLLEASGSGVNYTSIKAAATMAGNVTYTLPATAPATNGQVISSTTAGVMSWADNTEPVVKYVTDLAGLASAIAAFNTANIGGIIKLGATLQLVENLPIDLGVGIEIWGGGFGFDLGASAQYKIIVEGSRGAFRNVAFTGNKILNGSNAIDSQPCIEVDDSGFAVLKMVECRFTDIIGSTTGVSNTNVTCPIHIKSCANWSIFEFLFLGIGTQAAGNDKNQTPLGVFWTPAITGGTRFIFKDLYNNSPEPRASGNRFTKYRNSLKVGIYGSNSTTAQNQVVYDETLTIDAASTWPSMDLYPNMYGSSTVINASASYNPSAGSGAYGIPGDIMVSGSTIYMKHTDIGTNTNWKTI